MRFFSSNHLDEPNIRGTVYKGYLSTSISISQLALIDNYNNFSMIFLSLSIFLTLSFFRVILFSEGILFLLTRWWKGISLKTIRFSEHSSAKTFPLFQILSKSSTSFFSCIPELRLYSSFLCSSMPNRFKYLASKTQIAFRTCCSEEVISAGRRDLYQIQLNSKVLNSVTPNKDDSWTIFIHSLFSANALIPPKKNCLLNTYTLKV